MIPKFAKLYYKLVSNYVSTLHYFFISWDQMASFDLPAVLSYIKDITHQEQLYYIGHSQGTMIAFAEFSSNQLLAKSVRKLFALGPVSYLGNMKSPLKYLADLVPELKVCPSPSRLAFLL